MGAEDGHFDPYVILELPTGSRNSSLIRSQFRRLSLKHHPDKNPGNRRTAEARFNRVAKAYKVTPGDSRERVELIFSSVVLESHVAATADGPMFSFALGSLGCAISRVSHAHATCYDPTMHVIQALSDPEARRNWEKYGHPDGYQPWTYDLALPGWLRPGQDCSNETLALYAMGYLVRYQTRHG